MATCCSICLEPFQSTTTSTAKINRVPRMLWCGHTFCTHCLSQLIPSSTSPSTKETQIQCPIDHKITTLHPSNNNKSTSMMEELPINRAVTDMLSTLSFSPTPSPSPSSSIPLKCHACEQADATLYCKQVKPTCVKLVTWSFTARPFVPTGDRHHHSLLQIHQHRHQAKCVKNMSILSLNIVWLAKCQCVDYAFDMAAKINKSNMTIINSIWWMIWQPQLVNHWSQFNNLPR